MTKRRSQTPAPLPGVCFVLALASALASPARAEELSPRTEAAPARAEEALLTAVVRRPDDLAMATPTVAFGEWHGAAYGSTYLAPKADFIGEDGGVDLVFHFHAAELAQKAWRDSGLSAVVVSATYGVGTGVYSDAFADPNRFGAIMKSVLRGLERDEKRRLHVRRVGLVAWSAGWGAVSRILAVPKYFAETDAVVLLDGFHAGYTSNPDGSPIGLAMNLGKERVAVNMLETSARFARLAVSGEKSFVITHSTIRPPGYASTTETTDALLGLLGVTRKASTEAGPHVIWNSAKTDDPTLSSRADRGSFHVLGFAGGSTNDHMQHLHAVGSVVKQFLVPRWKKQDKERSRTVVSMLE